MDKTHSQSSPLKVLRSRKRTGEYVTLGTASLVGRGFASKEKVLETLRIAHERSRATILRHRHDLLDQ